MSLCNKCNGKLEFVRVEESSDALTVHNGPLSYPEQLVCRYECRSTIYRCVACGMAWQLLPVMTAAVYPAIWDHRLPRLRNISLAIVFLIHSIALKMDFEAVKSVSQKRYLCYWRSARTKGYTARKGYDK